MFATRNREERGIGGERVSVCVCVRERERESSDIFLSRYGPANKAAAAVVKQPASTPLQGNDVIH